ncbi:hypothetical protein DZF87_24595 [Vibrio parahaemolyticus]|nr:hypothetical protein [Vibrio parahaemolyticus]TOL18537.1 hypothetical protein CGI02_24600 [Vibrio parahaemolyticus]
MAGSRFYHLICKLNNTFSIGKLAYIIEAVNAALSGEQRKPPHLNHCAVNTKAESNRKCQALGIRLKRFVSCELQVFVSIFPCVPQLFSGMSHMKNI